ncbi:hypothetical protein [Rubrivirga sp. IMCC45206]|uniref:hypothetical protein n=1 Tax=Rubrivirga sp. IMCC45206 TaxID=3391614 RepID=UPI00398FEF34
MAYRIPWFYFGDTNCLIEGRRPADSAKLASAYAALDFPAAQAWSPTDPPAEPAAISAYMQAIMDLPDIQSRPAGPPDFQWRKGPLRRLAVRGATISPSELEREYILTPDTLYLPWPFFPGVASWTPPSGAAATMVSLDGSAIAGDHICLAATLNAVDFLVECPHSHPAILDVDPGKVEQAIRDAAKTLGYEYNIGTFSAIKRPGLPIYETRFVVDGTSLKIEVGTHQPVAAEGGGTTILIPEWPCGAFSGQQRPC